MDREIIKRYYASGVENDRLLNGHSRLEGIRTKEIISRYLNKQQLQILDVGGGAGFYSFWLQALGHDVNLIDLSPDNIEQARKKKVQDNVTPFYCEVGDATQLPFEENKFDIVLLLGPMYHLIDRTERFRALSEAKRVLKAGGLLISAYISRYASMMDGFHRNLIADDQFIPILENDLAFGVHKNLTNQFEYFTHAYFHTPQEIANEIRDGDLHLEKLIAVESLGWMIGDIPSLESQPERFLKVLEMIRGVESNTDIIGASPHLIAIVRKEQGLC